MSPLPPARHRGHGGRRTSGGAQPNAIPAGARTAARPVAYRAPRRAGRRTATKETTMTNAGSTEHRDGPAGIDDLVRQVEARIGTVTPVANGPTGQPGPEQDPARDEPERDEPERVASIDLPAGAG